MYPGSLFSSVVTRGHFEDLHSTYQSPLSSNNTMHADNLLRGNRIPLTIGYHDGALVRPVPVSARAGVSLYSSPFLCSTCSDPLSVLKRSEAACTEARSKEAKPLKFGVSAILSRGQDRVVTSRPAMSTGPCATTTFQGYNLTSVVAKPRPLTQPHVHSYVSCRSPYGTGVPCMNSSNSNNALASGQAINFPFLATFPWAAARGKPRRGMMRRAVFSDAQRQGLEKRFQIQQYISKPDRKKLAEKLGLKDSQVKIWFQNRRMKWRNSKERELLSIAGSREQVLPTRTFPNPSSNEDDFEPLSNTNCNNEDV
ncbi:homeobox protein DBX1-like [Tachypleus tridentatus]|uniref:homeobox protein DBX1-like n=1 Tax=Tachypleus tridentatus TaxID=6853 RepID=UPI003FD26F6B